MLSHWITNFICHSHSHLFFSMLAFTVRSIIARPTSLLRGFFILHFPRAETFLLKTTRQCEYYYRKILDFSMSCKNIIFASAGRMAFLADRLRGLYHSGLRKIIIITFHLEVGCKNHSTQTTVIFHFAWINLIEIVPGLNSNL